MNRLTEVIRELALYLIDNDDFIYLETSVNSPEDAFFEIDKDKLIKRIVEFYNTIKG